MVDGILVTLPDESVLEAHETCASAGVKIVAFNSGMDLAMSAGYLYFGTNETRSGYEAGVALASVNGTDKYCFVNHSPGVDAITDRWEGMYAGIVGTVEEYRIMEAVVDIGNCDAWTDVVYDTCRDINGTDDWSTVGLYVAGANHDCALDFLRDHAGASMAFSDVSEYAYDGLRDDGLNVLFVIDQQSYLQGYMPFSYLTLAVTNDQMIIGNDVIMTGPRLIVKPPATSDVEGCAIAIADYAVCDDPVVAAIPPPAPASHSAGKVADDMYRIVLAVGCVAMSIMGGYELAD